MAFRRSALTAVGGFDPRFRAAGDDVDLCWRIQQCGWTLGFNPAAVVWHRRRDSVRAYWKQQLGYGEAEALLEQKWPEKYNLTGHATWAGRIYGQAPPGVLAWRGARIYQGRWGMAPFQSLYQPGAGLLSAMPLTPEWVVLQGMLAALAALAASWPPLMLALPLLGLGVLLSVLQATRGAVQAIFPAQVEKRYGGFRLRALTAALYVLQPVARLYGRLRLGRTPLRRGGGRGWAMPRPQATSVLTQAWSGSTERLESALRRLRAMGAVARSGGDFDAWDLDVRGGPLACARLLLASEEYGDEWQLVRIRSWPRWSMAGVLLSVFCASLALGATADRAWVAAGVLAASALLLGLRMVLEAARAMSVLARATTVGE
jgi:hypothetical protein